jgi:hypothetical protein
MSTSLIIAAITEALRTIVTDTLNADPQLAGTEVTVRSLDRARVTTTGNQLNLFLYQVAPHAGWSNLPSVRPWEAGQTPLALTLHYLITAYGNDDETAGTYRHRILGVAMGCLHDITILGKREFDRVKGTLGGGDIGDLIEPIRITLQPLSIDEMSKLWTTFQTNYRVSAAYQVTVALIESTRSAGAPLPVLKRGKSDRGVYALPSGPPSLTGIHVKGTSPEMQVSGRLKDEVIIRGQNLDRGAITVRFRNPRLVKPIPLPPEPGATGSEIRVRLPDLAGAARAKAAWVPGPYTVSLLIRSPDFPAWDTNEIPFAIAPAITLVKKTFPEGDIALELKCSPRIGADQRVLLLFGDRQIREYTITQPDDPSQPTELKFPIPDVVSGTYIVRLRVDGIDSIPLPHIDPDAPWSPEFDPEQKVTVI